MNWQAIIEFIGGATAISLTLGYLGKKTIEAFIAGRVESYKSHLEKIALEHSVRFSSLHLKRAEIIAEIYELLSEVENQARLLATPVMEICEPPRGITYQSTASLYYRLYEKYNKTRIYFPDDICLLIDKFLTQSRKAISFYKVAEQVSMQDPKGENKKLQEELQTKFMDVWEEVEENVPSARIAIETEFRKILGVAK